MPPTPTIESSSATSKIHGNTPQQNPSTGVKAGSGQGAVSEWAAGKVSSLVSFASSMVPSLPTLDTPPHQVTIRHGVRLMVAKNESMGKHKLPAETPVKGALLRAIDTNVTLATSTLMLPKQDLGFIQQAAQQDEKLARHFSKISGVEMPHGYEGSICGTRFDIAKVRTADGPKLTMWEFNTTGWVSIHMMPDEGVAMLKSTCHYAGRWLAQTYGEKALAVVMASGREPVAPEKNSVFMHEKVWITQEIVAGMRQVLEPLGKTAEVTAFEPSKMPEMVARPDWNGDEITAKGLVGYFEQVCNHAGLQPNEDGVYFLHERQVGAFYNDRGVSGIQESKGTAVNTQRTLTMNPFPRIGTDKAMCYKAYNEFMEIHGDKFPNFVQRINYSISSSKELGEVGGSKVPRDDERVQKFEKQLVSDVKKFHRETGKIATLKPFNTGHGDGIEYIAPGATDEQIEIQVRKSLDKVWSVYNKDGLKSGAPYTIVEKFEVMGIEAPEGSRRDYADGWNTEFGLAVMGDHRQDKAMIRAMPYLTKLENPKVGTGVANVSSQMAATGRPAADFAFPICNREGLEDVGLAQPVADEMARFGSMLMQHVALNPLAYGVQ